MPNFRRAFIPGGTFFFTLVTNRRAHLFAEDTAKRLLGAMFRLCQEKWPFTIDALVLLPDHLHAIWSLPPGDDKYPTRWAWIKKEFTKGWLSAGGMEERISAARQREGRRGVWQRRRSGFA